MKKNEIRRRGGMIGELQMKKRSRWVSGTFRTLIFYPLLAKSIVK